MTTRTPAFSRIDLVALLGALGLLILLVAPALGGSRGGADRGVCLNNLRRVGQAFIGWGLNHQGNMPWRTLTADGGTRPPGTRGGNAWFEFAYFSNHLVTPTLLACPADERLLKVAAHWGNSPDGGFAHFTYRNNALSYFLGLEANPETPSALLAGDRNLRVDVSNAACSAGINNAAQINSGSQLVAWTNEIHGFIGNILFGDGRVALLTTAGFRAELQGSDDNGSTHLLMPR